jgi:hypothetical protein
MKFVIEETPIKFTINHKRALKLSQVAESLFAMQGFCNDFLEQKGYVIPPNGIEFRLGAVKEGSMEFTLDPVLITSIFSLAPNLVPKLTEIIDFIRASIEFYALGKEGQAFAPSRNNAENVQKLTNLGRDSSCLNGIFIVGDNNQINLPPQLASAAYRGSQKYLSDQKASYEIDISETLLKMDQIKDHDKNTSQKAIVYHSDLPSDISYRVIFSNPDDLNYIRDYKQNPFGFKFWADIQAKYTDNKLTAYKVLKLYKDNNNYEPIPIES